MRPSLRSIAVNLLDALLLNLAVLAALALRFDGDIPPRFLRSFLLAFPFYTAGILALTNLAGVNRALWRYAGVPTVIVIVRTLTLGFASAFVLNLIPAVRFFPVSVVIMTWILTTALILASRLLWKMARSPGLRAARRSSRRILIVGAGDVGALLARELQRSERAVGVPVGFVDDDPQKQGRRIETLPVLGTTYDIPRLIEERRVNEVLLAAPSAPSRFVRSVVQICQESGIDCRTVPALTDYIAGKGALGQIREVQIEDLLGREPVSIDVEGVAERVRNRTVLVTGAGGSIGSELCRQLARFQPRRLLAVDHCENRLCYLGLDLNEAHPDLAYGLHVADIRDEDGMREIFQRHRPHLVFHAAAHKHVHFLEENPREAVLNNILGTRNVARAAELAGVETFVFVSTDKAVNPSNIMGASKRACEIVLQGMSRNSRTTFVAVRFGNVLGSDGSVLPIFKRQLARGGPLTVTHPDVRRYFMTIPEASQLVIQAALLGVGGEVFVLDMGEQVRIVDVAEQLIRLSGLRPGVDVPIRFIGLRPGEKLEEELLSDSERTRVTEHKKIFRLELDPIEPERVQVQVERLVALSRLGSPEEIRSTLLELVPEYRRQDVVPIVAPKPESIAAGRTLTRPSPARIRREPAGKRPVDLLISLLLLVACLIPTTVGVAIYRLGGGGSVELLREVRVGRNRRFLERRRLEGHARIDRRYRERRQNPLPGPTFTTYRLVFSEVGQSRLQRSIGRALVARGMDRVFWLWNVVRGEMSLVGPASRLVAEAAHCQDLVASGIFARRPGLVNPGSFFRSPDDSDGRRAALYDAFYARHGGFRLDLEAGLRAVGSFLRGEVRPPEEGSWSKPAGAFPRSPQEGTP